MWDTARARIKRVGGVTMSQPAFGTLPDRTDLLKLGRVSPGSGDAGVGRHGKAEKTRASPVRRKPPKEVACRREPNGHGRLNGAAAASLRSVEKLRPAEPDRDGGMFQSRSHVIGCPTVARTRRTGKAAGPPTPDERSLAIAPDRLRSAGRTVQKVRPAESAPIPTEVYLAPAGRPAVRSAPQATWCATAPGKIEPRSGRRRPGACGTGMNLVRKGIFFPLAMAVVESVRHAVTEGSAAGGGTMRVERTSETRSYGAARPPPDLRRRGPASGSPARAEAAASAPRARGRPRETAWRGAPGWGTERRARGGEGTVGTRCVPDGLPGPDSPAIPRSYSEGQASRGGSAGGRLARDNYCYQEPTRQFHRFRRAAPRPPGHAAAILVTLEINCNLLDCQRVIRVGAPARRHPGPRRVDTGPAPSGEFGSR